MKVDIHKSWEPYLEPEFKKPYFKNLIAFVKTEYQTTQCFPKENNVVFLLWGGFAKKKKKLIDTSKHMVLETGHPSPLSANRGYWFGNKHFSKTNSLLEQVGLSVIDWRLQ